MDFGKSFTYVFEDPNWVSKLAIGGAILLVGVLFSWLLLIPLLVAGAILLGYALVVRRNVAEGNAMPLPEWNDFGTLISKGFTAMVGVIIWFVPLILISCCLGVANAVLGGMAANGSDSSSSGAGGLVAVMMICLNCLISLVSLVLGFTLYAPLTRFALNGQLSMFWDFGGSWNFIRANLGNYVIAWIILLVANFIAGFGVIACFIGLFFTQFWAHLVGAHLFGQIARSTSGISTVPPSPMLPMEPPPMEPMQPAA